MVNILKLYQLKFVALGLEEKLKLASFYLDPFIYKLNFRFF